MIRVLELRCKLLQVLQTLAGSAASSSGSPGAGQASLQALVAGMRAELQLQAARTLTAHRCIDMAQQLLDRQAGDLIALQQSASAQLAGLVGDLRDVGVLASAELSVRRAEISPRDPASVKMLDDDLQASCITNLRFTDLQACNFSGCAIRLAVLLISTSPLGSW